MSKDWYQDIVDFHKEVMQDNCPTKPVVTIPTTTARLRKTLIIEEIGETLEALSKEDVIGLADGIVDSIVVLLGTAVTYGIDIRPVWDEIHRTNMLKVGGELRPDGKRLKPKDWLPPRIAEIIDEQKKRT